MNNIYKATPNTTGLEIGLINIGEYISDPQTEYRISAQQRLQEIVAAAKLADESGLDVFGVGEHHSSAFVVSAVPVVLATIAEKIGVDRTAVQLTPGFFGGGPEGYTDYPTISGIKNT